LSRQHSLGSVGLPPPSAPREVSREAALPFANGFATPSGKALLRNDSLIKIGLDPVASFTPPVESRHAEAARRFPLEMLARKADNFLNTTFCNLESVQAMEAANREVLEISGLDAGKRGI